MVNWDEKALADLAKAFFAVTGSSLSQEQKDSIVHKIESYGHEINWDRIRCVEISSFPADFQRPPVVLLLLYGLLFSFSNNFSPPISLRSSRRSSLLSETLQHLTLYHTYLLISDCPSAHNQHAQMG